MPLWVVAGRAEQRQEAETAIVLLREAVVPNVLRAAAVVGGKLAGEEFERGGRRQVLETGVFTLVEASPRVHVELAIDDIARPQRQRQDNKRRSVRLQV